MWALAMVFGAGLLIDGAWLHVFSLRDIEVFAGLSIVLLGACSGIAMNFERPKLSG